MLRRWTALSLAVEHGWGGQNSAAKAEELYGNLLEWFYTCKGALLCSALCPGLSHFHALWLSGTPFWGPASTLANADKASRHATYGPL